MPKAVVDPDDLYRFAIELKKFGTEVQGQLSRIQIQFAKLGETWQDQEHAKFAAEFLHTLRVLTKFVGSSEEQVPILLRKAESIRRYLEQRWGVAGRAAHIRSPEILRRLRAQYIRFDEAAHRSLESIANDIASVSDWLKGEQLRHWKLVHRRRHEEMKEAWREYVNARYGDRRMGKPSSVDERKAWERAKRLKEEAEQKIETVKAWTLRLGREVEKLRAPCVRFDEMLTTLTPRALARLDHLLENLGIYMEAPPPRADAAPEPGGADA